MKNRIQVVGLSHTTREPTSESKSIPEKFHVRMGRIRIADGKVSRLVVSRRRCGCTFRHGEGTLQRSEVGAN